MKTYYVDPDSGSDSYTETQAQSALTPWKTIGKAATTCDNTAAADGNGVSCYIKVTNGKTVDAGAYLDLNRVNPNTVVIQPVTNPGDFLSGFTLSGSGGGGAIIRHFGGDGAKWRFENCTFAPTGVVCLQLGAQALSGLELRDCTLSTDNSHHLFYWQDSANVDTLILRRCSFTPNYTFNIGAAVGSTRTHTISNVLFDSCINNGPVGPYFSGPGNNIRISGGTWTGTGTVLAIGNLGATKSSRNTNVIVEDASFTGNNGNHVLMLDGDGVVCRRNTIHTGSAGSAGYGIVCKWGYGYQVYGNTVYAESAASVGLVVKGVTEAGYFDNKVHASGSSGACIEVYNNDSDGNKKCRNLAARRNRFITSNGAQALWIVDADPTCSLDFDQNDYQLTGSGRSVILGTTVAADTPANIRAAWLADAAAIAGGWTENELNRYQGRRPRIACALAG